MIKLIYPKFWSKENTLALLLIPASWIYRMLGFCRKIFTKKIKFSAQVICIGNATVGGTGKTQLVAWLAKTLKKSNISFVIITKGYGSSLRGVKKVLENDTPEQVGDESVLLREFGTVIAASKISYATGVIDTIKPDVIIVDDGMQNPSFHKDLIILTIDSLRGIGNGLIFPAGPLRQSLKSSLKIADAVVMIGNEPCKDLKLIERLLLKPKLLIEAKITLKYFGDLGKKYLAFTAIGNPDKFYKTLTDNKINVLVTKSFPDHHFFSSEEIYNLKLDALKNNLQLITTKKDYVKIHDRQNIECAEVDLLIKQEEKLLKLIDEQILQKI